MTVTSFRQRLSEAFAEGRRLCVGIDPHSSVLDEWGLPDTAMSAEFLGLEMIAAAHGQVACVKPQIAFFERFGQAGYAALERVFAEAREADLPVIADVKRGDIGSSFAAYADTWLRPGSPLEADAMTVHAYQGFGTLEGAFRYVIEHGKGLFVLAATSNPEAKRIQQARIDDGTMLAAHIVDEARDFNRAHTNDTVGGVGVVLGATVAMSDFGIDTNRDTSAESPALPVLPVLSPGFGFQGARVQDARNIFGALSHGLLVSESRSLMGRGNRGISKRIRTSAETIAQAYAEAMND